MRVDFQGVCLACIIYLTILQINLFFLKPHIIAIIIFNSFIFICCFEVIKNKHQTHSFVDNNNWKFNNDYKYLYIFKSYPYYYYLLVLTIFTTLLVCYQTSTRCVIRYHGILLTGLHSWQKTMRNYNHIIRRDS